KQLWMFSIVPLLLLENVTIQNTLVEEEGKTFDAVIVEGVPDDGNNNDSVCGQIIWIAEIALRTWNTEVFGNVDHKVENPRKTVFLFYKVTKIRQALKQLFVLKQGEIILDKVSDIENHTTLVLTNIPSFEEVKSAVFSMDSCSAPSPDGFGGSFCHHFWDIIGEDVYNSALSNFEILQNFTCKEI
ncbi:hypothetical protein CR513_03519, partial [Mucuna pruriens]